VSLDGATEATHDAVRGKGSFRGALATIAIARVHDKEVVIQMVAHRGNSHELEQMALLASKMDATRLHIAHMQPTPHAVEHSLLHSPEEYRRVEDEVRSLQGRFRMPIAFSAGFYDETPLAHCKFLRFGALNIDYAGRLTTCCQLSNMEGDTLETDVVSNLQTTSLETAHMKLLEVYQEIFDARLQKMQDGTFQKLDNFHCWHCLKHFKKVDWMKNYPENEWVKEDHYFKGEKRWVSELIQIKSSTRT
jgi:MoaA/NifB/PqqE/SkfB family radical SAM enzyme